MVDFGLGVGAGAVSGGGAEAGALGAGGEAGAETGAGAGTETGDQTCASPHVVQLCFQRYLNRIRTQKRKKIRHQISSATRGRL